MDTSNARKAVGNRLRNLLFAREMTITDLAEQIGMQRSNLSMVLRGDNTLMPEFGVKVAQFFGITMDQLYDEREEAVIYAIVPKGMQREEFEEEARRAVAERSLQLQKEKAENNGIDR